MQVFFAVLLVILLKKRLEKKELEEINKFVNRFGTFFVEFSGGEVSKCLYYVLFAVKRIGIALAVVFLNDFLLQLVISMVFAVFVSSI